jgi:hypothetical protein
MKDSRSKTNEQKGQHDTEKQGPEDHTGDVWEMSNVWILRNRF